MDEIDKVLTRGVESVLPNKEGLKKLMQKKQITLYQGFDPSMPSLHLGSLVGLMKLRQFQKLGHKVIFLVGDFTGMIGDPSGKSETRKTLTHEEVLENAKNYKKQAGLILDFEGNNPAELLYNSEWLSKLSFIDVAKLASHTTYAQVAERDMFQKRMSEGKDLYLSEFLYPLMQGYDSVHMNVDLEVGGSDQIFNMLMGRTLMKKISGKEKFVLSTKLLVDKEGSKIGKTTGNALFLDVAAEELYAGIMSFPDEAIYLGFELLTEVELQNLEEKIKTDPMGQKKVLSWEIVKNLWGEDTANTAQDHFEKTFQEGKLPDIEISVSERVLVEAVAGVVGSKSEAKRLLAQKAIEVNGKVVEDPNYTLSGGEVLRIGKKQFVKIK